MGNGAAEIIKILSGPLASRLIIPVPSFNEYANAAPPAASSSSLSTHRPLSSTSTASPPRRSAAAPTIAVIVSPNNPTSLLVPHGDLLRLLELLEGHDCTLIVDESFIDFADAAHAQSLEGVIGDYRNLAVLKSMSKAYGICGLRIGYLLSANEKLVTRPPRRPAHLEPQRVRRGVPSSRPRLPTGLRGELRSVRADRDAFYEDLHSVPGLTVYKPDANFIFCRLPDASASGSRHRTPPVRRGQHLHQALRRQDDA